MATSVTRMRMKALNPGWHAQKKLLITVLVLTEIEYTGVFPRGFLFLVDDGVRGNSALALS